MSHRIVGNAVRVSLVAAALLAGATPRVHAQGQLAIGQAISSQLTAASPVNSDGRRYALWTFMGQTGQYVQIDMQSGDIDSYLILQDQNGNQLQYNDDGGGGLNARITYTLPYSGVYRVMAMSFRTSGVIFGTYTLSISSAGMMTPQVTQMAMTPSPIAIGQSMMGQLTQASPVNSEGRRYALWMFSGVAGQAVQVDMTSNELDSYLILQDEMGNELARNDDGGGGLNSRINYTLPRTGTFRIMAMSFRTSGVMFGTYTLALQGAMAMAPQVTPMGNVSGVVGTIQAGQQAQGVLSQADARYDGKPFQAYNFACVAGQAFQMDVTSSWDNYALVFDPMGNVVARDDDSGGSLNARVTYTCLTTGTYRLAVTAFSSSTTGGAYTMQVTSMAGPTQPMIQPAPPVIQPAQPLIQPAQPLIQPAPGVTLPQPTITGGIAAPGQVATIAYGQMMQGRLEQGDQTMNDGTFADVWTFQGNAGQTVTVDVMSDEFDAYCQLLDAAGNRLGEDDDSGGNLNARLTVALPASGQYQIVVNNFGDTRRTGLYRVWLH
jgi:hypothetical protein